jgi:endonuclease YncB( thermonuclease family)
LTFPKFNGFRRSAVELVGSRRPVGKQWETRSVFHGLSIGDRAGAVRRKPAQPAVHKSTVHRLLCRLRPGILLKDLLLILLAGALQFAGARAHAETIRGHIVGITDGDSVTLLTVDQREVKIRLAWIDAPEKRQAFGEQAKTNLARMVFRQEVEADCGKLDMFKRPLCVIYLGSVDINLEQIRQGMAWHFKRYARRQQPKQRDEYAVAEFDAKVRRQGLWLDKNPVPPWEFRHPRHN